MVALTWLTVLSLMSILPASIGGNLKILGLFPHPAISHYQFFHPIMRALAEKGHDVTVVSHFPDKNPPAGYTDIVLSGEEKLTNSMDLKVFESRPFYRIFLEFFMVNEWGKQTCNHTLRSEALQQILRQNIRYDVIILEQFNTDCIMGIAHLLQAPVIAVSSCAMPPWLYERMGMPIIPSYMPSILLGHSEEMTLGGRILNWISTHLINSMYSTYSMPAADSMLEEVIGHGLPSVSELVKETSIMFVNQHFSLSGAKPLPPSVIELGGIHIQKAKPLNVDLQKFLDNADNGVVFISWGSMIKADTLPLAKRDAIVKAVKRLKQRVIWKWENDTLPNKPENMYISKWLPQRDILCHPNVKVFMTHGGLMGSSEAAYCGVPVVATPMYGDQFLNAAALQHRGMGVILQYEDINESNVFKSINTVLDKQYLYNAKKVSHSYKNRPQNALDTAIWWVEYVANTKGGQLMKSSSTYMSRFAYYSLDVYTILGLVGLLLVITWGLIIRKFSVLMRPKASKLKAF